MSFGEKFSLLLDTKPVSQDIFRGERILCPNPRAIYGGELMAQALVAASKTVPEGYRPHSLHCYFHSPGNVKQSNDYKVIRLRDGRSLAHRLIEAYNMTELDTLDDALPFFRMDCSFKSPEEDPACFVAPMPNVSPVEKVPDVDSFVKNLNMENLSVVARHRIQQLMNFDSRSPMEMRLCEPECLFGLKSNPTGRLHAWMRVKQGSDMDLRSYRDAFLTYFSDAILLWVAITEPHPVTFLVTLSQSIWFHNPQLCPEPDEWILFETRAHYVGDTLTLSYGAMWDKEGHLLASVAQQGLMRTQAMTPVSSAVHLGDKNGS